MVNRKNKIIVGEKLTKRPSPRVKEVVEIKMEILEMENQSLCFHRCLLHCALTVEFPRLKLQE